MGKWEKTSRVGFGNQLYWELTLTRTIANHGNYNNGAYPAFGGFINDSTAQMGIAVGQQAFAAGQAAVEREVSGAQLFNSLTLRDRQQYIDCPPNPMLHANPFSLLTICRQSTNIPLTFS